MNELEVFWVGEEPKETQGFHNVLVSESYHPWMVATGGRRGTSSAGSTPSSTRLTHFLDCIVNDKEVAPVWRRLRGRLPHGGHLRRDPGIGGVAPDD